MTTIGKYRLIRKIGSGGFSKVMLAENTETGEKLALKIMKNGEGKKYDLIQKMLKDEVSHMKDLDHPNILKLTEFSDKEWILNAYKKEIEVSYIAMEYAENGEFFDYIANSEKFSEKTARYFFHQLIETLEYLHGKGKAHRDIKPENLLFDKNFNLKLADFGFWTDKSMCSTRRGTLGYMAPEVLAGLEYNPQKADIFSAAVILFIMVTQHCPFIKAEQNDRYYKRVIKNNFENYWKLHSNSNGKREEYSDSFKDLVWQMINQVPDYRPSIEEIKNHEWYKGPVASKEDIEFEFRLRKKSLETKMEVGGNSEKNAESQGNKETDDTSPSHSSSMVSNSDKEEAANEKQVKLKSQKFIVGYAEILIDAIVWFWETNQYEYEKSTEFFRVNIKVGEDKLETHMEVNVCKSPNDNGRTVEVILLSGSQPVHRIVFTQLSQFLCEHLNNIDN